MLSHGVSKSTIHSTTILVITLVLTFALLGFGYFFGGFDGVSRVRQHSEKWAEVRPAAYSYHVSPSCFCGTPNILSYVVTVTPTTLTSLVDERWGAPFAGTSLTPNKIKTIESLFEYLEDVIPRADEVDVSYDEEFGFPVSISVDYWKEGIDDEYAIQISDFRVLQGAT